MWAVVGERGGKAKHARAREACAEIDCSSTGRLRVFRQTLRQVLDEMDRVTEDNRFKSVHEKVNPYVTTQTTGRYDTHQLIFEDIRRGMRKHKRDLYDVRKGMRTFIGPFLSSLARFEWVCSAGFSMGARTPTINADNIHSDLISPFVESWDAKRRSFLRGHAKIAFAHQIHESLKNKAAQVATQTRDDALCMSKGELPDEVVREAVVKRCRYEIVAMISDVFHAFKEILKKSSIRMEFGESLKIAELLDVEVCRMHKKVNGMDEVSPETWFETFLKEPAEAFLMEDVPAEDDGQPCSCEEELCTMKLLGASTLLSLRGPTLMKATVHRVNAANVSLSPTFERVIAQATRTACAALQVDPDAHRVSAHLDKLLVFSTGGPFTIPTHRESLTADGRFATMVVQLPVLHAGGALVVQYDGKTLRADCSDGSDGLCTRQLSLPSASTRWNLWSLAVVSLSYFKSLPPLSTPRQHLNLSQQAVCNHEPHRENDWEAEPMRRDKHVWKLTHKYASHSLCYNHLLPEDRALVDRLCGLHTKGNGSRSLLNVGLVLLDYVQQDSEGGDTHDYLYSRNGSAIVQGDASISRLKVWGCELIERRSTFFCLQDRPLKQLVFSGAAVVFWPSGKHDVRAQLDLDLKDTICWLQQRMDDDRFLLCADILCANFRVHVAMSSKSTTFFPNTRPLLLCSSSRSSAPVILTAEFL